MELILHHYDPSPYSEVVWIVLILLLPVIGFIAWLIAGPRGR
jgi:hypothetical protein